MSGQTGFTAVVVPEGDTHAVVIRDHAGVEVARRALSTVSGGAVSRAAKALGYVVTGKHAGSDGEWWSVEPIPDMQDLVYVYGCPAPERWEKLTGRTLPEVVSEQLRLANRLRNALVEVDHQADEARTQVWSGFPGVAAVEAELASVETAAEELAGRVAEARKAQRTTKPNHPAVAQLREVQARAKALRAARKAAISEVREAANQMLTDIRARRDLAVRALYTQYSELGLYWGTINDVIARHNTAVQRVIKDRAQGKPAEMRFHRYTGSGGLTVQLQRSQQAGDPPRNPELLASGGGKWRNVYQLGDWSDPREWDARPRRERRTTVTMRTGDQQVTVPVVAHRALPVDAEVTGARLVVRKVGPDTRVSVHTSIRVPAGTPQEGPTVAVHCGWRREADDAIRVATWRASESVTVPETLLDVVRVVSATTGIVVLPDSWRDGLARPAVIQADRDRLLNELKDKLVGFLRAHPLPVGDDEDAPTAGRVEKWRSPRRFVRLAHEWAQTPPPHGDGIVAELRSWQEFDRGLWRRQEHGRNKHLGRRADGWRRFAAWVASIAGAVVVDDTDLAGLVREVTRDQREGDGPALPVDVVEKIARQRVDAAPGELRQAVATAMVRDHGDASVVTVASANLSREHTCGHVHGEAVVPGAPCGGCGRRYDPDLSATMLMLSRAASGEVVS